LTTTRQLGLFAPSSMSHAVPEAVVPGQELLTERFAEDIPGGSALTTYLEISSLVAVQSSALALQEAPFQLEPRTIAKRPASSAALATKCAAYKANDTYITMNAAPIHTEILSANSTLSLPRSSSANLESVPVLFTVFIKRANLWMLTTANCFPRAGGFPLRCPSKKASQDS